MLNTFTVEKMKIKKKSPGMAHFYKSLCWISSHNEIHFLFLGALGGSVLGIIYSWALFKLFISFCCKIPFIQKIWYIFGLTSYKEVYPFNK